MQQNSTRFLEEHGNELDDANHNVWHSGYFYYSKLQKPADDLLCLVVVLLSLSVECQQKWRRKCLAGKWDMTAAIWLTLSLDHTLICQTLSTLVLVIFAYHCHLLKLNYLLAWCGYFCREFWSNLSTLMKSENSCCNFLLNFELQILLYLSSGELSICQSGFFVIFERRNGTVFSISN